MWKSISKRPRRANYAVNKIRPVSGWKVWKAISHYVSLVKRVKIEWETKWIKNAFEKVMVKLRKYWINTNKI